MKNVYLSGEAAKKLGIGSSTMRRYAHSLEEKGYRFKRAKNNSRMFYEKDMKVIQQLITNITEENKSLEEAVEETIRLYGEKVVEPTYTPEHKLEKLYEQIEQLEKNQTKLLQTTTKLANQLKEHQQFIKEKMEEQDEALRDQALLISLRNSQDEKVKKKPFSILGFLPRRSREA